MQILCLRKERALSGAAGRVIQTGPCIADKRPAAGNGRLKGVSDLEQNRKKDAKSRDNREMKNKKNEQQDVKDCNSRNNMQDDCSRNNRGK